MFRIRECHKQLLAGVKGEAKKWDLNNLKEYCRRMELNPEDREKEVFDQAMKVILSADRQVVRIAMEMQKREREEERKNKEKK